MTKVTLITHPTDPTSFNAEYLELFLSKFFNIVTYDETVQYDIKSSLIIISTFNNSNNWYKKLSDLGFKILIENLWEKNRVNNNTDLYTLLNKNWFWYNESFWFKHLGYDRYIPNKQYTHMALMPMRLQKYSRVQLIYKLQPYLNDIIYSYVAKGMYLPNDLPHDLVSCTGNFQRHFNPNWYNNTYYSIVAESHVDGTDIFVTEKTFKPIAFYHPFLILGQSGILQYLKTLGFETFSELFDEAYDNEKFLTNRLTIIEQNVKNFSKTPYSKLTQDKLQHNRNLFYNQEVVEQKAIKEIINPMLELVNG